MRYFGLIFKRLAAIIFGLYFSSTSLFADEEVRNFRAYSANLQIPGAFIQSMDDKYTNSGTWANGFTVLNNKAVVELGINEEMHISHTAYFKTKVTFDVQLTNISQGVTLLTNQNLEIDYDPAELTRYKDKAQLIYYGYYKVKVFNVVFQTCTGSNMCTSNSAQPDIYMEAEISTNKAYPFTLGVTTFQSGQYNKVFQNANGENELEVYWDYVKGANQYELEYTYIDDYDFNYSNSSASFKNPSNILYDLQHDATRILTPFNFYRIPLNYEHGYLVYRIRPVSFDASGNRVDGDWAGVPESSNIGIAIGLFPNCSYAITTAFSSQINWVSSKLFNETGKTNTGIVFTDAKGLNRQSILRLNTEEKSIVQSTLYDHYGRAKINIMPVPVSGLNFNYRQNLNKINVGNGSVLFDKRIYDLCSANPCSNTSFVLDAANSAGAANYYSPFNPDLNSQEGFVPDANGYAYSEVKYMSDNTNRISRQSMAGATHFMGSGKDVQYFYSHPSQVEVDRLFGKEAGTVKKYTKNFIIDPNGQTSTSYIDMYGRTVATALLGDEPPGVDPIPDKTSAITLVDDLADPSGNLVDSLNNCIDVNTSFFVASANAQQTFVYNTTLGKFFPDLCPGGASNICLDCVYDLEISIKDECGNELFWDDDNNPLTPPNKVDATIGSSQPYGSNCNGTVGSPGSTLIKPGTYNVSNTPITIVFPHVGTYNIHKRICVSDKPIDDYVFISETQGGLCSNKYCDVVDSLISTIDFNSSCKPVNCQGCLDALSTYTNDPKNPPLTNEQLNSLYGNCQMLCPKNICQQLKLKLSMDFVPGSGFFAATSVNDPNWAYSILNPANTLGAASGLGSKWYNPPFLSNSNHPYKNNFYNDATVLVNGVPFYPDALSSNQFTTSFQLSWAEAFLPIHPEYCKMKFYCDVVGSSVEYDQQMKSVKHFNSACANGFLKPYVASLAYGPPNNCLAAIDPIFSLPPGPYTNLINALISDFTANFKSSGKNIYLYVSEEIYGGPVPSGHTFGSDPCTSDLEWQKFLEYYETLKNELYTDMLPIYLANFVVGGFGECASTLPTGFNTHFPDDSDLMQENGIDPNWTYPANATPLTNAANVNISAQCAANCAAYVPLWDSELTSYCTDYVNLNQSQKNKILAGFEAICNLGCDATHPTGSSTAPNPGPGYLIPSSNVTAYSFQDIINYYMNLYQQNTCSSYLISSPAPYANTGVQPATNTKLSDCKCDQLLKIDYDLANNINIPFGITEGWQLFLNRYGFDLEEYNLAICQCKGAVSAQGGANWSPGFSWNPSGLSYLGNITMNVNPKLECSTCTNCSNVVTQMNAQFSNLPIPSIYANVYDAIKYNFTNAAYITNYLNINNDWNFSSQDYLDFWSDCNQFSIDNTFPKLITSQSYDLLDYLNELVENKIITTNHPMKLCTDSKYFLSKLYNGSLPLSPFDIYDYQVTVGAGNALTIDIKKNNSIICTINLALPVSFGGNWSNIIDLKNIVGYAPNPAPGQQFGFQITAEDNNFNLINITGSSTCYKIGYLSISAPFVPVKCPEVLTTTNQCQISKINTALQGAANLYQQFSTSNSAAFIKSYKVGCLSALHETFTRVYQLQEYHYTLYYYDMAGNTQRVVAPKGVTPLAITTNLSSNLYPAHSSASCVNNKYVSQYKFNTYNQALTSEDVDGGLTNYFYEKTGRLVASQNAQQLARSTSNGTFIYSYTLYDKFERIIETGEVESTMQLTQAIIDEPLLWQLTFETFCNIGIKRGIIKIFYDTQTIPLTVLSKFTGGVQKNVRNRIAYSTYSDLGTLPGYKHGIYYSYDEHGNVMEVVQHNTDLEQKFSASAGIKKIVYEYELISNKMNKVIYQPGEPDQMMHKYYYDADDRLSEVYTSKDALNWDRDAKYFYYQHGPLARIERADKQVQGMDYFYTINGWVKGVNSDILNTNNDAGKDGAFTNAFNTNHANLHGWVATDAMAYSLNYFQTGNQKDYDAINRNGYNPSGNSRNPLSDYTAIYAGGPFNLVNNGANLYNGNISSMVTSFIDKDPLSNDHPDNTPFPQLTAYRYDQLQRLKQMMSYRDITANSWNASTALNYDGSFLMQLNYDKNGNITSLKRDGIGPTIKAGSTLAMDDLTYTYAETGIYGLKNTNKLIHVEDVSTSIYADDIKAPGSFAGTIKFDYDEIGNLIKNKDEYITSIEWTIDRKVKKVNRDVAAMLATGSGAGSVTKPDIEYEYNSIGQRVVKIVKPRDVATKNLKPSKDWLYTYYVYEAGGNLAAVYDRQAHALIDPQIANTWQDDLSLAEHHIYGSERLALARPADNVTWTRYFVNCGGAMADCQNALTPVINPQGLVTASASRKLGYKEFELTNHLGNVIATVSDRKIQPSGACYNTGLCINSWDMNGANPPANMFTDNMSIATSGGWLVATMQQGYGISGINPQFGFNITPGTYVIQFDWDPGTLTSADGLYAVPFDNNNGSLAVGNYFFTSGSVPPAGHYCLLYTPVWTGPGIASHIAFNTNSSSTHYFKVDNLSMCLYLPGTSFISYYKPDILMHTDYYAFGQNMPGRTWQGVDDYRYGFNGKESDKEVTVGWENFGARIYDNRLGRMLSRDPFGSSAYPSITPYSGMGSNPIVNIDVDGELILYFNGYAPSLYGIKSMTKIFTYWSVKLLINAKNRFGDKTAFFYNSTSTGADGRNSWAGGNKTPASERIRQGAEAGAEAALFIKAKLDEERKNGSGSGKINAIGHSMGVAYSQGFVDALRHATYSEGPNKGQNIFSDSDFGEWWALAPYQPKNLNAPLFFEKRIQFSSTYDAITKSDSKIKGTTHYFTEPNGAHTNVPFPFGVVPYINSHSNYMFEDKFKYSNLPKYIKYIKQFHFPTFNGGSKEQSRLRSKF